MDLIASTEELLSKTIDPKLKEILEDYLLEKKFLALLPNLNDNPKLNEICKDRDDWDRIHSAAFTDHWRPDMYFSSFDKASISFMPEDNNGFMGLLLSSSDYRCGSYNYEERALSIFKEWLFATEGEKPWISWWQKELISDVKYQFNSLVKKLFPERQISWFYTFLGVNEHFFEGSVETILSKISRFQNFNYFLSKAHAEKIQNIYPLLCNFEIIVDPKDTEDGRTTLINYLISLDNFNPLAINKVIKSITSEQAKEAQKKEKIIKEKELKKLSKKFSKEELEEIEKLLKLKKELNK